MNYIILDIETGPLPEKQVRQFMTAIEAPSNYKDADKIKAYVADKEREFIEAAALKAHTGQVLAVGMTSNVTDIGGILTGDEAEIIDQTWNTWHLTSAPIIGHNIKGFDMPFLIRRSYIHGIRPPANLMRGRYFDNRVIDTMEAWMAGTQDRISLANLARALGVGEKTGSGADFAKLFGTDREAAIQYLRQDLSLTESVARRMGIIINHDV